VLYAQALRVLEARKPQRSKRAREMRRPGPIGPCNVVVDKHKQRTHKPTTVAGEYVCSRCGVPFEHWDYVACK
jgi:hypothetical protein